MIICKIGVNGYVWKVVSTNLKNPSQNVSLVQSRQHRHLSSPSSHQKHLSMTHGSMVFVFHGKSLKHL
jgi:hypothetical protein